MGYWWGGILGWTYPAHNVRGIPSRTVEALCSPHWWPQGGATVVRYSRRTAVYTATDYYAFSRVAATVKGLRQFTIDIE